MRGQKIISVSITLIIIVMLLISGNVNALVLNFTSDKNNVIIGDQVKYNVVINHQAGDPNIDFFVLNINGPSSTSCTINISGKTTGQCKGIEVEKISVGGGYGYGYGYGYGKDNILKYMITFTTSRFQPGSYIVSFSAHAGNKIFSQQQSLLIEDLTCSVRARGNDGVYNDEKFNNDRINLFLSKGNSRGGLGSLTMQDKNRRLSLTFEKKKIIEHTKDVLIVNVTGEGLINRKSIPLHEATVVIDKKHKKVSVSDGAQNLTIEDIDIYFIKDC